MPPKKFKINKIDIYLILSILLMITYTVVNLLIIIFTDKAIDAQLTICFFATFGGELFCACAIKAFNIKNEKLDPTPIDSNGGGVG